MSRDRRVVTPKGGMGQSDGRPPEGSMYRVLVVEDDPAVAKGLLYGLREELFDVSHAATCAAALEKEASIHPHLIVLDVRLPDGSGFDVCKSLRSSGSSVPIIMLTARDEETDRVLGLELGADDYVVKPFSFRELVSRIRAHLRRAFGQLAKPSQDDTIRVGAVTLDLQRMTAFRDDTSLELTPTELRLLLHLVRNSNKVLSRVQILEAVWGPHIFLQDERTVDVHIRHLREKIEADPSNPVCIETVRGFGYRLNGIVKKH